MSASYDATLIPLVKGDIMQDLSLRALLRSCLYLTFIEACYATLSPSQTAFLARGANGQAMVVASELFFPLQTFAFATGIEAVCALYPVLKTRENYWQALWFSCLASVVLGAATVIFAEIALIGKSPEMVNLMNTFLWSFVPGYPGVLLLQNLYNYLLSASYFRYKNLVAGMAFVSVIIELLISYFLVAPTGVASVGLATTIQTYLVFGVMSIYFSRHKKYASYFHNAESVGRTVWHPNWPEIKQMIILSWPLTASMMLQTISFYVVAVVNSFFSHTSILAFQIANQCLVPLTRAIYAFARVSTITIANLDAGSNTLQTISAIHKKIMKLVVGIAFFYIGAVSITALFTNELQNLFLAPDAQNYSTIIESSRAIIPTLAILFFSFAVYRTYIASFTGLKKTKVPLRALGFGTGATLTMAFIARYVFPQWDVFGVIGAQGAGFLLMALYLGYAWRKELKNIIPAGSPRGLTMRNS